MNDRQTLLERARKRGADLGYVPHRGGKRILNIKIGLAAACDRAGITSGLFRAKLRAFTREGRPDMSAIGT